MLPRTAGPARDVLHRDEAVERATRVQDVRYTLELDLVEDLATYRGRAVIEFEHRAGEADLFLDFRGHPRRLTVNGQAIEPDHRQHRLWLPASSLASSNVVEVEYENGYDVTGDGLHRFVDPEDGETYLYTNFEPFSAHRLFPCFDQPDLKATYGLTVRAPERWTVVSAEAASSIERSADGRREHRFPVTPRFSSYLFPLIAGPFERVTGRHLDIELGVLGRRLHATRAGTLG